MPSSGAERVRIGILGASGYTGAEAARYLLSHPRAQICVLTADRQAGQPYAAVFPHLGGYNLPDLVKIEDVDFAQLDLVFAALPHGKTQAVLKTLPAFLKIIDLSADFRLRDPLAYEKWYGHPHDALSLQESAVYGLSEIQRETIKAARLIANPGCYPTASLLPLIPLLEADLISPEEIIIDAKSGVSGAGREAKLGSLYAELENNLFPYGVGYHRHMPEIEQSLSEAARKPVTIGFTPHLVPMARGMLASIYVQLSGQTSARDLHQALQKRYAAEPFVDVLGFGDVPSTKHVSGTNNCRIGVAADRLGRRAMLFSAIDNLGKGASGQAVQNMNILFGFPETMGLAGTALYP